VAKHGEQHLEEVDADLQQTTFLLNEAIEKLSTSFMGVYSLITEQQELLEAIEKAGALNPEHLAQLDRYKESIGAEVNAVVTGLQFQDMTNQLLHRTMKRVNGLKELLQELASHSIEMAADQEHDDIVRFLAHINENLDASSHALSGNLRKSVGQRDMATGDIDLF
jgi:chemotaxis regulatin CheY-phosphate phosphatase CheZ